jgi:hypothetical protein
MAKAISPYHDILPQGGGIKMSTIEDPSHQQHLQLTSSSHYRFRFLDFLQLPKKMILMALLPLGQKVNSQSQRLNDFSITQFHFFIKFFYYRLNTATYCDFHCEMCNSNDCLNCLFSARKEKHDFYFSVIT